MALGPVISELQKAHNAALDKYTYFLLAVAGAAIAFAVQKTEGLPLSWWLVPVGGAALAWGASFYCGCKNITSVGAATTANFTLLQLQNGSHPNQPSQPNHVQAAIDGTESALNRSVVAAQGYARWQFRFIVLGALLFILWRVLEMWRVTP